MVWYKIQDNHLSCWVGVTAQLLTVACRLKYFRGWDDIWYWTISEMKMVFFMIYWWDGYGVSCRHKQWIGECVTFGKKVNRKLYYCIIFEDREAEKTGYTFLNALYDWTVLCSCPRNESPYFSWQFCMYCFTESSKVPKIKVFISALN